MSSLNHWRMATIARTTLLQSDREVVSAYLDDLLRDRRAPDTGTVCEAMRYAVLGDGQRIRPLLSLRVARLLGSESPAAMRSAAAVELLHCASLIVDDLPCMDNETMRRNRATVHIAFGESTAVLSAFALVALAARIVVEQPARPRERERLQALQIQLLRALDCSALVGGQALDLLLTGEQRDADRALVSHMKTVPLFQLAVEAGMVSAEPTPREQSALRSFGSEFGEAFQLMDDYLDEGIGIEPFERQLAAARDSLQPFGENAQELKELLTYLHGRAWQQDHCHR